MNPPETAAGMLKIRKILMRRICRPSHKKKQIRKKEETKRIVVLPAEPCGGSSWRSLILTLDVYCMIELSDLSNTIWRHQNCF
mmetsp:Transcript_31710/g.66686  ORF Transcript_31710/g.66686 Transcript_31710/m.66686 type:complete len:83 (+) Transcript_31710:1718-1966(+)